TFGMRVIGSLVKLMYPSPAIATAMTMGGIGFRIDHAEMFTAIRFLPLDRLRRRKPRRSDCRRAISRLFDLPHARILRGRAAGGMSGGVHPAVRKCERLISREKFGAQPRRESAKFCSDRDRIGYGRCAGAGGKRESERHHERPAWTVRPGAKANLWSLPLPR